MENKSQFVDNMTLARYGYLLPVIMLFLAQRSIFFAILFIVADYLKNMAEKAFSVSLPVYPLDYGIILLSYRYSPVYGIILSCAFILIRLLQADLKASHLTKVPLLMLISVLAGLLNYMPIAILGPGLFFIRYALETLLRFGAIEMKQIIERAANIIAAAIFFNTIGLLLLYVM